MRVAIQHDHMEYGQILQVASEFVHRPYYYNKKP